MTAVTDRTETALPSRTTLRAWDEDLCLRESAYELVAGVPTMPPPSESLPNRDAVALLQEAVNARRPQGGWLAITDMDVTVDAGEPPTVRKPDLVVRRAHSRPPGEGRRLDPRDVLSAVEVVSPSSLERDHVTKRAEYARAGIPAYLVVDLRSDPGSLWLYEARDARGEFVDVEPAERVTLQVGGVTVPLRVTDLIA